MTEGKIRALAKLYELLSEFSEMEFRAASSVLELPQSIRQALDRLALARRELNSGDLKNSAPMPDRINRETAPSEQFNKKPIHTEKGNAKSGDAPAKLMQRILMDRHFFKSTKEMTSFFKSIGLPMRIGEKDGRARIQTRFENAYGKLASNEKQRVQQGLARLIDNKQTSGWFRVIRGDGK